MYLLPIFHFCMISSSILLNIPSTAGVYLFRDRKDLLLYVGKAKNLYKRVQQYFAPWSVWKQDMMLHAEKLEWIETFSESEALYLEENFIKQHHPEYNRLLQTNTQYVYLKITHEPFPQFFFTRYRKNDKATYIWPKHATQSLKKILQYCCQYFKCRSCSSTQFKQRKLCSAYYFGMCRGRCVQQDIGTTAWAVLWEKAKNDYTDIVSAMKKIFSGDITSFQERILLDIEWCIQTQNFEWAQQLKEIYQAMVVLTEKQSVVLSPQVQGGIGIIQCIWPWYIICFVSLCAGKIVDVVRTKKAIDDISFSSLLLTLEEEIQTITSYIRESFPLFTTKVDLLSSLSSDWLLSWQKVIFTSSGLVYTKKIRADIFPVLERSISSFLASDSFQADSVMDSILQQIQQKYMLKKYPYRMECLDISHFSGDWTSWWLSCFVGGLPYKKGYRRFKIGGGEQSLLWMKNKSNDYASLKEVLLRRFKTDSMLPDLFILDGGKGQLGVVREILQEYSAFDEIFCQVCFVALGKGEARKKTAIWQRWRSDRAVAETMYRFDENFIIREKNLVYDEADKILVKIRNEAHRFANAYREKQMEKEWK